MEIFVKLVTGRTIVMRCSPDDELTTIKWRLYDMGAFPPDQQRLIYGGMSLDDDKKTLSSYKIKEVTLIFPVIYLYEMYSNIILHIILIAYFPGSHFAYGVEIARGQSRKQTI